MRRVPLAALAAAAISVVGNSVLFLVGRATGAIGAEVALPNGQVFGLVPVISVTVTAAIGAAVVYAILGAVERLVRRPITVFRIIAVLLLLGSLVTPFGIAGAGTGMVILLNLMHVVTAAANVWALTTLARR